MSNLNLLILGLNLAKSSGIFHFWDLSLSVPPEKVEKAMDEVEKYIMTRQYKYVFCPETTDDEKKDLAVQKRIR